MVFASSTTEVRTESGDDARVEVVTNRFNVQVMRKLLNLVPCHATYGPPAYEKVVVIARPTISQSPLCPFILAAIYIDVRDTVKTG